MLRPLCTLVLAIASVPCQQTLVVDQSTGPYTTIGAAVAAASSGDRIEVHPGNYHGFTVTTGVEIAAPPGAVIVGGLSDLFSGGNLGESITISGIPATDAVRLDGIGMASNTTSFGRANSRFSISNCAGAVHLHRVSMTATGGYFGFDNTVDASSRVVFSNCTLTGMALTNASATFESCTVHGEGGSSGNYPGSGQAGLGMQQSRAFLSNCTLAGGSGGLALYYTGLGGPGVSGDAASSLTSVGQGGITGGPDYTAPLPPGPLEPAIVGLPLANVRLGPNIAVTPVQPVTTIAEPPQLTVPLTLPLGTNVAIAVGNAANQSVLLAIDTSHDLITLPGIELPFVLSTGAVLYAFAPPSPTSPTSFSLFVPPAPWLANVFVYWQAATVDGAGAIQFSNGGYGRIQ